MKKTVNIRFLLEMILVLVIVVLLGMFFMQAGEEYRKKQEPVDRSGQQALTGREEKDITATLAEDALFLLKLEENHVVIYHAANGELYDKTDISKESLSEELKKELQQGKPVYSTKELYDFLENYSS